MKTRSVFLVIVWISSYVLGDFRVVGYFPAYRVDRINAVDWSAVSHVMAAFLNPSNGDFVPSQQLRDIVSAARARSVPVYISIGGGAVASSTWLGLMTMQNRLSTVQKIVQVAKDLGAGGIDVDLEGDLVQAADYNPFVSALHAAAVQENISITAALARWNASSVQDSVLEKLEFINLMSYDYKGPWNLTPPYQHSSLDHALAELDYYANTRNVPREKIVLGVPFYGYDFAKAGEAFTWATVVQNYPSFMDVDSIDNASVKMYYNGKLTIRKKSEMAAGYGGIMIWELGQDVQGTHSLLAIIKEVKDSVESTPVAARPVSTRACPCFSWTSRGALFGTGVESEWYVVDVTGRMILRGRLLQDQTSLAWEMPARGMYIFMAPNRGIIGKMNLTR